MQKSLIPPKATLILLLAVFGGGILFIYTFSMQGQHIVVVKMSEPPECVELDNLNFPSLSSMSLKNGAFEVNLSPEEFMGIYQINRGCAMVNKGYFSLELIKKVLVKRTNGTCNGSNVFHPSVKLPSNGEVFVSVEELSRLVEMNGTLCHNGVEYEYETILRAKLTPLCIAPEKIESGRVLELLRLAEGNGEVRVELSMDEFNEIYDFVSQHGRRILYNGSCYYFGLKTT
ncbi:hypothetical protein [Geoglobus ahangari]